jgi:hypothetical protein
MVLLASLTENLSSPIAPRASTPIRSLLDHLPALGAVT